MIKAPSSRDRVVLLDGAISRLPVQNAVLTRLLTELSNDETSAKQLGRLIESDPVLLARLLRLANSPFCGGQTASDATQAVVKVGFTAVRSLAAAAVCQGASTASTPEGFWNHSLMTASAAQVIASRLRLPAGEAFSAGMVHDLGLLLLSGVYPDDYKALSQRPDLTIAERAEIETELFGVTHGEVSGRVLRTLQFPDEMVIAVIDHHHDLANGTPTNRLARVLIAAEALIETLEAGFGEPTMELSQALKLVGLDESDAESLSAQTLEQFGSMAQSILVG